MHIIDLGVNLPLLQALSRDALNKFRDSGCNAFWQPSINKNAV
jgi:hypothetical protein